MSIHVVIASHLTDYRYYTIKQCVSSVDDCVKYVKLSKINVYISYSYDNHLKDKLDDLDKILMSHKNINVIIYRHHENQIQFKHIDYIISKNNFDLDDWIMFQDDDDLSNVTRLHTFFKCLHYNFDVFKSYIINFERDTILTYPYGDINNLLHKSYIDQTDFATTITTVRIIKEFMEMCETWTNYTDVAFTIFTYNKKTYISEDYLYFRRTRMYTTDERFNELINLSSRL
jgi:hypothetical protein